LKQQREIVDKRENIVNVVEKSKQQKEIVDKRKNIANVAGEVQI